MAAEAEEPWLRDVGPAYQRIPAEAVGAPAEVKAALAALVASGPVEFQPAASAELSDVLVYGSGPTVTASGGILDETLNCARNVRRSSRLYRPFDERFWVAERVGQVVSHAALADGRHHVLLKQTWDRNFGHWLVDALPKVGLLRGVVDLADCVFIVNRQTSKAMKRVVLDSLALAGVAAEQVQFQGRGAHRFEKLIVLGTTSNHPLTKSPFAIRFLEEIADPVTPSDVRRIYLSRNDYSRRRLRNEEELVEMLSEQGYSVVSPETLSFRDQVAIFRGATHVVGNLGAAMSSLVFSPRGVSVLALTTQAMKHDFFYDIVCHKDGRYRGLQGTAVREPSSTDSAPDLGSDFVVDPEAFGACLEWLHATDAEPLEG